MENEFIVFSISDYLVSDKINLNLKEGLKNMIYILESLNNNISTDFEGSEEEKEMLINHLNTVIDIYKSQGQSSKHNIRYNLTGWSGHSTFQLIYNKNNMFEHYYFNSGEGINNGKHNFRINNVITVNPLLYYQNTKDVPLFNSYRSKDQVIEEDLKNYSADTKLNYFVEAQEVGNCVFRTLLYPISIIVKLLYNKEDNYLNYLLLLVRLYIINEGIEQLFNGDNITSEDKNHLYFIKDLIEEKIGDKYYTKTNPFGNYIIGFAESITDKINKMLNTKMSLISDNEPTIVEPTQLNQLLLNQ